MSDLSRRRFIQSAVAGAALGAAGSRADAADPSKPDADAQPGPIDQRQLGKLGRKVSILGAGLGSAFTRPHARDHDAARALLENALAIGVTYYDTARAYGPSERIIGPFVKDNRKKLFLVSKSGRRDYDGFNREVETSLKNLQTDHIDLYHLHNFSPWRDKDLNAIENGAVRAARKLKDQGIIGGFGVTGHSGADILIDCIKKFDPDAVLTVFPATRPDNGEYEDKLLPLAREKNMGVIAMKTVRHARNADLKASDLPRYAMSLNGVHCTIVGLDSEAHLRDNAEMATNFIPLDAGARNQMTNRIRLALHDQPAPWDMPGYNDHVDAWGADQREA